MTSYEIRRSFIDFFLKKGHQRKDSASLIPNHDPSLLFTNAGMVPFKSVFTGQTPPPSIPRIVTAQKCLRAGGKHNDLEHVGKTPRHHTFFEMLGNFSFGDYFKREAILFAWEFLTHKLSLPKEKLYVTVHESDQESWDFWEREVGIEKDHLFFRGDQHNFWSMGELGPCGPCSEIFFDHGAKNLSAPSSTLLPSDPSSTHSLHASETQGSLKKNSSYLLPLPLDDEERYVEIWNLVFMQYELYQEKDQSIHQRPLPKLNVDTGMGLERVVAVLQGVKSNFDTDLFSDLISNIESLSHKDYQDPQYSESIRVVADHMRSATLLITEMVLPSNEGRGYVLRRIIRRAVRHLQKLGLFEPSLHRLVDAVFQGLKGAYPQNEKNHLLAKKYLHLEESHFQKTLSSGTHLLEKEIEKLKQKQKTKLSGKAAFKMYDTYGFPLDLTELILKEHNLSLDHSEFRQEMREQKKRSKKANLFSKDLQKENSAVDSITWSSLKKKYGPTQFLGYETTQVKKAKLLKIIPLGSFLSKKTFSQKKTHASHHHHDDDDHQEWALLFDTTPFYAESGGQTGDEGLIYKDNQMVAQVKNTFKPIENLHLHLLSLKAPAIKKTSQEKEEKSQCSPPLSLLREAKKEKETSQSSSLPLSFPPFKLLKEGEHYTLYVNEKKRSLTSRNHSATHLMHAALIQTLGKHIKQAGSSVTSENLRFDFTHPEALKKEEVRDIEDHVNRNIMKSIPVTTSIMKKEEALACGATALFNEKYGDKVRVVKMEEASTELCGGTHVSSTDEIGFFSLVSESSLASGIRRIEALTSEKAYQRIQERMAVLEDLEVQLQTRSSDLSFRVDQIISHLKEKEKEVKTLKDKLLHSESRFLFQNPEPLSEDMVFKLIPVREKKDLRKMGDIFLTKYPKGVTLIYTSSHSPQEPRAFILLKTFKGNSKINCSSLIKVILSQYQGQGGGRSDNAQGSVPLESLKRVLEGIQKEIKEKLLKNEA